MEQMYSPLPLLDTYRLTNEKPRVRNELSLLDLLAREFLHIPNISMYLLTLQSLRVRPQS